LVSPNRHEPPRELGDILFDIVGRFLRELPSVISAARVPREFELLSLEFPVWLWVKTVIDNDRYKLDAVLLRTN